MALTIGLNLIIRIPAVQQWVQGRLRSLTEPQEARYEEAKYNEHDPEQPHEPPGQRGSSVRVFFPWKAMLIGSVILTVLINVLGAFR